MQTRTQAVVLSLFTLSFVFCTTPVVAVIPRKGPVTSLPLPDNLQEKLEALMENRPHGHRSALGIAVLTRDELKPVSAYAGYARIHRKIPSHPLVIFPAGSLGNPVIAALVLNKVHIESMDLDEPVNQYLPVDSPIRGPDGQPSSKVTLRHLLSHSSGLGTSAWESTKYPDHETRTPPSIEDYVYNSGGFDAGFEPGERVIFSNDGIAIAGVVGSSDQKHRGMAFEATVNYDVMMKTWMVSSTFDPKAIHWGESDRLFALMYGDGVEEASEEEWLLRPRMIVPGGVFWTTPVDMAYFSRTFLPGPEMGDATHSADFITPKLATEAITIQARDMPPYEGWDEGWGLGWMVRHGRPGIGSIASAQSSGPGHTSSCQLLLDYGVSITVLSNMAGNEEEVHGLVDSIIRLLLNPPVPKPIAPMEVPMEHLPGMYAALDGVDPKWWYHQHFYNFQLELADDGKALMFWDPWSPLHKGRMEPLGGTRFLIQGGQWHGSLAEFRPQEDIVALGPGLRGRHVHILASGPAKRAYAMGIGAVVVVTLLLVFAKYTLGMLVGKPRDGGKKDS